MYLTPEQQQVFNKILDLIHCLRRERNEEKKTRIEYLIEEEKNRLMKSMSFRDYLSFMREAAPLFS
jgi:hypothetical protein